MALRERGIDTQAMVLEAGLDPARIELPGERFPLTSTTLLWKMAVRETGDESLGLWVSKHSNHTTFHALGYAFMASKTLLEALERVVRFNEMVSDAAEVALHRNSHSIRIQWKLRPGDLRPADEAVEALIAAILRACRKLGGKDFCPLKVNLVRPVPANEQPFHSFFRCELAFSAPAYALEFRPQDLESTLPWANDDLARSNDRVAEEYLSQLEMGGVVTRLRTLFVRDLPSGVRSHNDYAKVLGMSGRSLQRKLSDEGVSFNQVLNETRCKLAKSYLASPHRLSLTEIAFLLGFSDTSSFSRAFNRWTGKAPSEYQRHGTDE